jgi:NAD(P)-dependent dehydrogenase (short-subunit alcohol dehydrogenase family)
VDLGLAGRHVVVTGGTGALGGAIVRRLLEAGARVHVPVRRSAGLPVHASLDVREGVELVDEAAVTAYFAGLPGLWASVHAVGAFAAAPLLETTLAAWRQHMDTNATGAFLCTREALRRMAGAPGRVVNVVARAGVEPRGAAGFSAYAASKAALAAFTQAVAEEFGAQGVLVNAVAPSVFDTPANRAAMPQADASTWPAPEEIAESIAWLASPANRVVRGALVPVPGRS